MNYLSKLFSLFLVIAHVLSCNSQKENLLTYIDQNKPSATAKVFAPNFISKEGESEFGSVFSKDGTEFYYAVDTDGRAEIRYTKLENKKWSTPVTIISHEKYGYNDPFLSPDENELFYISNMPRNALDTINDIDIWYSKKIDNQWSEPINVGNLINSDKNEYYISFASNGTMYFASNVNAAENRSHNFDIYSATRTEGIFNRPVKLSETINTKRYEADVFVAPDESYLIFSSARREGLGNGDLYISFKNKNGEWNQAKNMGTIVNTESHELCPFVTYDGKYLFYTSKQDIYWISTEILNKFK
ncbi:hypothetical protein UMM65_01970 [Aureibaculum sp. 2210JD6-5]|uniref:hypothetical protein n=1 Tax=Aureibaculum sp. 2210JD6-5 TaxID=3103957 RepID=UPI002AACA2F6|nr:hypothetical protein [Aureibaculum sp. 2210JD6-5]MDY7393995.1 hypothetical protein [Aureibaculum sp. 2210JD6-5]